MRAVIQRSTGMQYFKNSELAKLHHVSKATVGNWIEAAKQGKLNLSLYEHGNRAYIAKTTENESLVGRLVKERKKYRNSKSARTVTPRPDFYTHYNQAQIYDIVRNLEIHHELPLQYNYYDGGAANWDNYATRLFTEEAPNLLKQTINLFLKNQSYIDDIIGKFKSVNVVDVGVGNALPAKDLLAHLLEKGKLGRYIAIDDSAEMLDIAKRNIQQWFKGRVNFEAYELDVNYERFANILASEYLNGEPSESVNLILFLGGTPDNFRYPDGAFRTIHDSMNLNDLLFYTNKLETEEMRPQWLDLAQQPGKSALAGIHGFTFELLNIDESFYELEVGYNEKLRQRHAVARLKMALTLKFEFEEGERLLEFNKGDAILLWRSWQMNDKDVNEQFERNDFDILHSSKTRDKEYILTIAQVKCE